MRLIFLGPPGVGKGTQAAYFSRRYNLPHIATGDLLRTALSKKSALGLKAKAYMESGRLVPDQIIIELMGNRLKEPDARPGYILDGFPRTMAQGRALSEVLDQNGSAIDRVLYFSLDDEFLMERIVGRRSCPACHAIYHVVFRKPEQDGFCRCGAPLVQRKDDRPETVTERLAVYHNETAPLIAYYKEQNILTEIHADAALEKVSEAVMNVVEAHCSGS